MIAVRYTYAALLQCAPDHTAARRELSLVQGCLQDLPGMLANIDRLEALGLDATSEREPAASAHVRRCDWSQRATLLARLTRRFATGKPCFAGILGRYPGIDDPAVHQRMARCVAGAGEAHTAALPRPQPRRAVRTSNERLRTG